MNGVELQRRCRPMEYTAEARGEGGSVVASTFVQREVSGVAFETVANPSDAALGQQSREDTVACGETLEETLPQRSVVVAECGTRGTRERVAERVDDAFDAKAEKLGGDHRSGEGAEHIRA